MNSTRQSASRLKSSNGCFTCKKRRKKCDEHKPRCAGCARNKLKCEWPALSTEHTKEKNSGSDTTWASLSSQVSSRPKPDPPFEDDSTKIGRIRSAVYGIPGIKTSMDHYLCLYFRERFMTKVLRANAHPAFHDTKHLVMIGAEASISMRAFLATAAIHASWTNPKLRRVALRYYNSIVTDLRKGICEGKVQGGEDWLILTTNFLLLFEINQGWNTNHNPAGAAPHLSGLGRILKIRIANSSKQPQTYVHPQDRITAESYVLWASCLSLFYSDIDLVDDVIDWNDLRLYLDHDVFPGASKQSNSPLLASDWKLHREIFEITMLSHKVPLNSSDVVRGHELEAELDLREKGIRKDMKCSTSQPQAWEILQQTLIYILVARIIIFKTLRLETSTNHPQIQQIVAEVMAIVRGVEIGPDTRCVPTFCWPLAIVACAVSVKEDISVLRELLNMVWLRTYCGEVQLIRNAVEVFWERAGLKGDGDGFNLLDALVCPGGMFNHPLLEKKDGKALLKLEG
ncbi:hypothetical protein BGZ60DRAFT_411015 [Tricladium varicosporioides]|nr:hypothetical protein BGZ60DRAFT_411015 [Hymenoscyphus varicosporioides]